MTTTENFFVLDELISPTSVLVELKKCFVLLSRFKSGIGNATNQQLAQLFALSQMRKKSGLSEHIDKSVLCDLFFSRIALRVDNGDKGLFAITTMYEKASDCVACLLFLMSAFSRPFTAFQCQRF